MQTIDDGRFDPIATRAGFFQAPLAEVLEAFTSWQRSLDSVTAVQVTEIRDAFPHSLAELDPLVIGGRDRYLLIDHGDWTAYFDNGHTGTDPVSPVGHLTRMHGWFGVTLTCAESVEGRWGALQFELMGPEQTDWLNRIRSISLTEDEGRWSWNVGGEVQPFEDVEAYTARRKTDRLTPEALGAYCEALGFDPFDWTHYGRTMLVRTELAWEDRARRVSLAQRRVELGVGSPPG